MYVCARYNNKKKQFIVNADVRERKSEKGLKLSEFRFKLTTLVTFFGPSSLSI